MKLCPFTNITCNYTGCSPIDGFCSLYKQTLGESPIKEESQDELWKVVSKIIHSTHRMEDALGKLNCQFHITRKQ